MSSDLSLWEGTSAGSAPCSFKKVTRVDSPFEEHSGRPYPGSSKLDTAMPPSLIVSICSRKYLRRWMVPLKGIGLVVWPRNRSRKDPAHSTPSKQEQSTSWASSVWFLVRGSSPTRQLRSEQSAPSHPNSQRHPCIARESSQSLGPRTYLPPPFSNRTVPSKLSARLPSWASYAAASSRLRHCPCPEHSPSVSYEEEGHLTRWHALPVHPSRHLHSPVSRSQYPKFEHSCSSRCAVSL
mmetsp:Transcript_52226/g.119146  ORF Transcript_52226/g.119146 Transcript_52226/m.119146 type:complete len:238 (-) Transcript_52226:487-1200(-)